MGDYRKPETDFAENLSVSILENLGMKAKRNNLEHIGNVDILVDDKIKIDIQYSQNFARYGDLRLDFVSAYSKGVKGQSNSNIAIFKEFEEAHGLKINKVGKYFQQDYLDAVMILFYNELQQQNPPDKILIISKQELLKYLNKNTEKCLKNLKLNNKENLGDIHGSAFLPIKVIDLKSSVNCFFDTLDNLKKVKDEIITYLTQLH